MSKIKHSHETGILSHLELVIMLTKASEELNIDKAEFFGDDKRLFQHVMQQAYEHGRSQMQGRQIDITGQYVDTAELVDVAAIAKELPYSVEEIEQARVSLKLAIEAAAHLASSCNMTLDHAVHQVGQTIKAGELTGTARVASVEVKGASPLSWAETKLLQTQLDTVTQRGLELQAEVERLRNGVADSVMMLEQDQRRIDIITRTGRRVVAERNNLHVLLKVAVDALKRLGSWEQTVWWRRVAREALAKIIALTSTEGSQ